MQVNSINSNYTSQKQSFTGGIQSRLFNKLAKEGGDYVSLSNKIVNRFMTSLWKRYRIPLS